jgi:hypothetical protein
VFSDGNTTTSGLSCTAARGDKDRFVNVPVVFVQLNNPISQDKGVKHDEIKNIIFKVGREINQFP